MIDELRDLVAKIIYKTQLIDFVNKTNKVQIWMLPNEGLKKLALA